MSYGAVPIITNGDDADKIVTPDNGYILPLDVDVWVKTILKLLDDEKLITKLSQQARNTIKDKFSIENWFNEMMQARK